MENDEPKPVPEELSVLSYVNAQWLLIEKDAYQGLPISHAIERLDNFVQDAVQSFNNDELLEIYDWLPDISAAIATNRFKKDWLQRTLLIRKEYVDWWNGYISTTHRDLTLGAFEARKLLILSHGAAVLGAMAALGTLPSSEYRTSFLVVACGGLFGLLLSGVGIVIWLESFGSAITQLHSDFKSTHLMRRYIAYGRYLRRSIGKGGRWSTWLTYTSFALVPIYSAWALSLMFFA